MGMRTKCDEFLTAYGMNHNAIDLTAETDKFTQEMKEGLKRSDASLMMLPTYLSVLEDVPYGEPIVVIDAGGTNFRVAVVTFQKGKEPLIEGFQRHPMPGTQGTLTREEFFGQMAEYLLPVIDRSQKVGFCFSYPSTTLPNKDGVFLEFSKEVSVTDMEGAVLGENLNQALGALGVEEKQFLVLNDSVAALLGGIGEETIQDVDGYVGLIYGTGVNACYVETSEKITKDKDAMAQGGSMVINIESGGYGKFPRGTLDQAFDATTNNPGVYTFEKMMSGAYLGGLMHIVLKQAVEDGLFSESFRENFPFPRRGEELALWDVAAFLEHPEGDNPLASWCDTKEDRELLVCLLSRGYERAAKLIVVCLGGILQQSGQGKDPSRPVCVVAEGTTFEKSPVFRKLLDELVEDFLAQELGIYLQFVKVEDVTLKGTAVAGLIG